MRCGAGRALVRRAREGERAMAAEHVFIQGCLMPDEADADAYRVVDVTLSGGVIEAIVASGGSSPPAGATVIAGKDKLLLPGAVHALCSAML